MRTYVIELRVDFDLKTRKEKEEAMLESVRMCAKQMFAIAVLQSDKRKPQIMLTSGDLIESESEINLAADF